MFTAGTGGYTQRATEDSLMKNGLQQKIEAQPNGARFYRCAFQVNTFEYLRRHGHATAFATEQAYNAALAETCLDQRIEAVAITDHYRIAGAARLTEVLRTAGIIVFPGFEAVSRDGVHFLCIFDPSMPVSRPGAHCRLWHSQGG
jgi:hypothetical protein